MLGHGGTVGSVYPCALQRQVLLQGKLYLSQHHISFHANIFGVVTNLNIPLSEVVTIEKRNTAVRKTF